MHKCVPTQEVSVCLSVFPPVCLHELPHNKEVEVCVCVSEDSRGGGGESVFNIVSAPVVWASCILLLYLVY